MTKYLLSYLSSVLISAGSRRAPIRDGRRNMTKHFFGFAVALSLASIGNASAQLYPSRPVTMIVPFGAGGPADAIGRIVAEGMRGSLGQPVVVENVVGASGTIGVGRVAGAPADGYTLVLGNWATHVLNGPMFALKYDLMRDFEPVSLVSSDPLLIVAKKALPAENLKEFIAWLKASPGMATQGTTGAGGISTVGGLFFQKVTGTRFKFVPYRGGLAPAMQDLSRGPDRFHDRHSRQLSAAGTCWHHQGLCSHGKGPLGSGARYPDRRRGGPLQVLRLELASDIYAQGHRRARDALKDNRLHPEAEEPPCSHGRPATACW